MTFTGGSTAGSSAGRNEQTIDGEEDLIAEELNRARMDLHENKSRILKKSIFKISCFQKEVCRSQLWHKKTIIFLLELRKFFRTF